MSSAERALSAIATRHDLDDTYPDEVRREVEALLAAPGIDDSSLDDARDVAFVTIDDAKARDLDQAIHVSREAGGFRLRYAIADAAWFVRRGGAIFEEALRRGASFYLPGRTFPMLPRELSEGLVSLNPDVDRRAMVFDLRLDEEGRLVERAIRRARVRSRAKLAFDDVQRFLDGEAPSPAGGPEVAASMRALRDLGERRLALAEERAIIRYRRTELEVRVGGEPARFVAVRGLRNDVERYNEQVSLLCNVEGARFLASDPRPDVQPIYRVHPPPDESRVAELEAIIADIVGSHGLDASWAWRRDSGVELARYLDQLPEHGARARIAKAIHRQALVINNRSSYRAEEGAHFGVGAPFYARFTAPMREVVGVFVHGEAWEKLGLERHGDPVADEALRERVMESANRARDLQKRLDDDANRVVLDGLFARDLEESRPARSGTLMGITPRKLHVLLDDPPIDVKVYTTHLRAPVTARIGDRVLLRVTGHDEKRDRWILELGAG